MFKLTKIIKNNLKLIEIILVPLIAIILPLSIKSKVRFFKQLNIDENNNILSVSY